MPRVLVTGANGQLASEIKEISIDFKNDFIFKSKDELDISDYDALDEFFANEKIDFVINSAAFTAVDLAENESEKAHLINEKGVKNLAQICEKYNVYLVHISTDYVFDGTKNLPYQVDDKTSPKSVYGLSKLLGEQAILSTKNLNATIIRTSWVFSKYGKNFVKTMLNLMATKSEISVVSDQVGSPTYAADLAEFILKNLNNFKNDKNVYHFANSGVCSWYDFAYFIVLFSGKTCKINAIKTSEYPTLATRPHFSVLDTSKLKGDFNFTPKHWSDRLKDCLKRLGEIK